MSTTAAPHPVIRANQAVVPGQQRAHRRAVIRWALSNGGPVHRDALAALVGARAQASGAGELRPAVWSGPDVGALLWVGVSDWCADAGVVLPEAGQVAVTLATWLRFLSAHQLLAPGSDSVVALRRAVTEYGGTPARSSSRPAIHPSMGHSAVGPVLPLA